MKRFVNLMLVFLLGVSTVLSVEPPQTRAEVTFATETIFEAEDGGVPSPWIEVSGGADVAGGVYVTVPTTNPRQDFPNNGTDELTYSIVVPEPNTYHVWARVHAPTNARDSMYIAVDDGEYQSRNISQISDEWRWELLQTTALSSGEHVLKLKYREAGLGLDRLIVTKDPDYLPSGMGENPQLFAFATETIFEAEDGDVLSPWIEVSGGADVAGGVYVTVPTTNPRQDFPNNGADELSYSIVVPEPNTYHVWARVHAPTAARDSMYIAVDDGEYQSRNISQVSDEWRWELLRITALSPGGHVLKLKYRESGLGLDRLLVTAHPSFQPAGMGDNPPPIGEPVWEWPNPYPQPAVVPPAEHPRLFVRHEHLDDIRDRMQTGMVKDAWARVQTAAANNLNGVLPAPPPGGSNFSASHLGTIGANAFLYLINQDADAGREAIDRMNHFLQTVVMPATISDITRRMGQTITMGAIVYDWCYDLLTPAERTEMIEHFVRIATDMEIGFPPTGQGAVTGHGAEAQLLRDQLAMAIAVYDEAPAIYEIAAGRFFDQYIGPRDFMYPSHSHHQGDSYGPYRYQFDLFAAWMFRRMGAGDVFSAQQRMTPYQWLYTRRPDGQLMRSGDSYNAVFQPAGAYWNEPNAYMLSAGYYGDPYLNHEFLRQYEYNKSIDDLWILLFHDPDIAAVPDNQLPLTKYFASPAGMMVARTGWNGGIPSNAVVAEMKIGEMWFANHHHLDAGSFQIYYKGGLALDSGIYRGSSGFYNDDHDKNYHKRSIAHNTMLVYDPDERFELGNSVVANDGGQRIPNQGREAPTLEERLTSGYLTGEVLGRHFGPDDTTPDYSYLKGDLTDAYSNKMVGFTRSFVFLNLKDEEHPAALFVYDHVTSSNPDFKKTWLLHSEEEPEIDGDTVTITRSGNGYNGKLVNKTLLPAAGQALTEKIGGPGNEFAVGGIHYPQTPGVGGVDESGDWRIELSPAAASATDRFLNVMQVMDHVGGPSPLPVESVASPQMVGAKVMDRVVLFSGDSEPAGDSVQFTLPGSEEQLRILITDLAPGYWQVEGGGHTGAAQYEVKDGEGVLYYIGGAGVHTLTRSPVRTLPEPALVPTKPILSASDSIEATLDNAPLDFGENGPVVIDGHVMLPAHEILAALGAQVTMAGTSLHAQRDDSSIAVAPGSSQAWLNGQEISLSSDVVQLGATIYIPVELLEEAAWVRAAWDAFFRKLTLHAIKREAEYAIVETTASSAQGDAAYTIDANPDTGWSVPGSAEWIKYDMGEQQTLNQIGIAWYKGEERHYRFKVEISADGVDWTAVYDGESGRLSALWERIDFETTTGRYVRITGSGYQSLFGESELTAISDVRLYRRSIPVRAVEVSTHDGNVGENAVDGNLATRWSAEGQGEWIRFDLDAEYRIDGIGTAWHRGDERRTFYSVSVSADGLQWTEVYDGQSSGTTAQIERISFPAIEARYVQLTGYGNSAGSLWNSLTEAEMYKADLASTGVIVESYHIAHDPGLRQLTVNGTVAGGPVGTVRLAVKALSGDIEVEEEAAVDESGQFTHVIDYPGHWSGRYQVEAGGNDVLRPMARTFVAGDARNRHADLSSLLVQDAPVAVFQPEQSDYSFLADHETSEWYVTPTTVHADAALLVNGQGTASGQRFGPISLDYGLNVVTVDVVSDDGLLFHRYNLHVNREPDDSDAVMVMLSDSQGNPLSGGIVTYYDGGWKDFGTTNESGLAVKSLPGRTYTFRMTYAGPVRSFSQDIAADPVVIFRTERVTVRLQDSEGSPLGGGAAQYYAGSWRTIEPAAGSGEFSAELLAGTYTFRMTYAGTVRSFSRDIAADPVVIFRTERVTVRLQDSEGSPLGGGAAQYYAGSWRTIEPAAGSGEFAAELLAGTYTFRMTYAGTVRSFSQDTGADPVVIFRTERVTVRLQDSEGSPLGGGAAQYYAGSWRTIEPAAGSGEFAAELLAGTYTFRMTYAGTVRSFSQDTGVNPIVTFQY